MNIFKAAMMSVCLAIVACGKPAPAPNKDFTLEKIGLTSISLTGNSLCDFSDGDTVPEYKICTNDGVIGIRDINSCFDVAQDPKEGKELYELLERLNNPAEKAAAEQALKELSRPRTVVELLSLSNGFKGMVYANAKGLKRFAFAMKRGDAYYYLESTSYASEELDFFDNVKAAIESIK